uniref:MULE transposase domain-containing protein n=1 Tax=Panagrolaimus davidi TaxID=227884 RepID=A0A914QMW8_9BILA
MFLMQIADPATQSITQLEVLTSSKNKDVIVDGGHIYNLVRIHETKTLGWRKYWRCYLDESCSATIITNLNDELQSRGQLPHTHEPAPLEVEKRRLLYKLKRRAADTEESTSQIVTSIRSSAPDPLLIMLPSQELLCQKVQRQRRRERGIISDSTIDFEIPEHLKVFERTNDQFEKEFVQFVLYDSYDVEMDEENDFIPENEGSDINDENLNESAGPDEEEEEEDRFKKPRIIIMGTSEGLALLRRGNRWYGDGTFDVSPTEFNQVFTLHANFDESKTTVPCLYILLERKTKEAFKRMFIKIKELVGLGITPEHYMCDFEKAQMNGFHFVYPGVQITGCNFHLSDSVRRKASALGLKEIIGENYQINMHYKYIRAMAFVPANDIRAPSPLTFISKLKAYHGKVLADIVQLRIGKNPRQKQRKEWKENDANKRNIVLKYHNQRDKFQFIKDIAATLA